jgi:hypothetical protein
MSYEGAWQISLVFRNELITLPHGDFERKPLLFDKELPTKIDKFQSADIERWINSGSTKTDQLVF